MDRLTRSITLGVACLGATLVLTPASHAQSGMETFNAGPIGPLRTNWGLTGTANPSEALTFPQFNPNITSPPATLIGVELSITASASTTFTVSAPAPDMVTGNAGAIVTEYTVGTMPTATTPGILLVTPTIMESINLPPSPQMFTATAGPLTNTGPYTGSFAPLIGTGTVSIPLSAKGASSVTDTDGNFTSSFITQAGASGSITYIYTNTPEPGSLALLAGSLVSGSLFLKSRKLRRR